MQVNDNTYVCTGCKVRKPADSFYARLSGLRKGKRESRCTECLSVSGVKRNRQLTDKYKAQHDDEFYKVVEADDSFRLTCCHCGKAKRATEFQRSRGYKHGFRYRCRSCEHLKVRGWRENFLVSEREYELLLAAQNGVCAICQQECKTNRRLSIDHCHTGGHVRGLLCFKCNTAIGLLDDDPARAVRAADYLLRI